MNKFVGLVKKVVYGLAHLPLPIAIVGGLYFLGGGIAWMAEGRQPSKDKITKCAVEYKQTDEFYQHAEEDYAEQKRLYEAGEIGEFQFQEKVDYLKSNDYAAELMKADDFPQYQAVVKKCHNYNIVGWTALASAGLAVTGAVLFVLDCNGTIDLTCIDEGRWPWDPRYKKEKEKKKEEETLNKIADSEKEEVLPEAKF